MEMIRKFFSRAGDIICLIAAIGMIIILRLFYHEEFEDLVDDEDDL